MARCLEGQRPSPKAGERAKPYPGGGVGCELKFSKKKLPAPGPPLEGGLTLPSKQACPGALEGSNGGHGVGGMLPDQDQSDWWHGCACPNAMRQDPPPLTKLTTQLFIQVGNRHHRIVCTENILRQTPRFPKTTHGRASTFQGWDGAGEHGCC